MEANDQTKRVIDLDPHAVDDETLAAIETEIRRQSDDDLNEIEIFDVLVLDGRPDGGLDSHATIFTRSANDGDQS